MMILRARKIGKGLEIDNRGELKNTLTNMSLIIKHDPALAGIYYNQLRDGVDADGNYLEAS